MRFVLLLFSLCCTCAYSFAPVPHNWCFPNQYWPGCVSYPYDIWIESVIPGTTPDGQSLQITATIFGRIRDQVVVYWYEQTSGVVIPVVLPTAASGDLVIYPVASATTIRDVTFNSGGVYLRDPRPDMALPSPANWILDAGKTYTASKASTGCDLSCQRTLLGCSASSTPPMIFAWLKTKFDCAYMTCQDVNCGQSNVGTRPCVVYKNGLVNGDSIAICEGVDPPHSDCDFWQPRAQTYCNGCDPRQTCGYVQGQNSLAWCDCQGYSCSNCSFAHFTCYRNPNNKIYEGICIKDPTIAPTQRSTIAPTVPLNITDGSSGSHRIVSSGAMKLMPELSYLILGLFVLMAARL